MSFLPDAAAETNASINPQLQLMFLERQIAEKARTIAGLEILSESLPQYEQLLLEVADHIHEGLQATMREYLALVPIPEEALDQTNILCFP